MTFEQRKEIMFAVFEFIITLAILSVGSWFISTGVATEFWIGIMTTVIMFWFSDKLPNKKPSSPATTEIQTPTMSVKSTPESTIVTTPDTPATKQKEEP